MDVSLLKTLLNSISRFSLLSSNNTAKGELVQRYYLRIDEILELLKPLFEELIISEIASAEKLNKVLKELDAAIDEARELIGNWHQMMSKVYFVLQIEPVITKLRTSALETCQLLNLLPQSMTVNSPVECTEKIQQVDYEKTSNLIKEAMRDQMGKVPRSEQLEKIAKPLSLSSNQDLLMEAVALEKLKGKVGRSENHAEVEVISQMITLVTHMHDSHVTIKQLHSINGVPIPADFCCPLSLELMSDPVIVASGQTYERAFIKKWLDQGFNVCPKTRQTLAHTNLIPNYTVKALIANWCDSNDIKLPDPIKSMNLNLPSAFLGSVDSSANDNNIPHSNHSPRSNHTSSPESNRSMMNSHKNSSSSNGVHQETYFHEPTSPHRPTSLGSPLHITNGCETNITRMSLASSDDKQETSLEERHIGSGGQTSNLTRRDHSQVVDENFEGHSRSMSASSVISNSDHLQVLGDADMVSRVSSDLTHYSSDASGEVTQEAPAASAPQREAEFSPRIAEIRTRNQTIWRRSSERFAPRIISSPSMESRPDLSGVETNVRKLIEDLKSDSLEVQRASTEELRLLARHNMDNRIVIANCGAINLLVGLLHSTDAKTQENAVTALLNLSINDNNKAAIANADAIDPLIHVLETGNPEAKENSAATLFSLSVIEENKVRIGRSGAIRPLVELLGNGTPRGKKDAATALFNLSIFHDNKARIVQAGAVRHLVELMDPAAGMVDKAVAVLANLATIPEGRTAIGHEGGIPVLVEVVELGSARGKENAAAALLQLCTNSNRFCSQILQEGAVPPLVALSQSGTARAKEKAQALLSYIRNQRHGNAGRM
ncbi:U-box domain-containing protein 4-like [Iris pallida]|uniref:RING-type E3 ubiquitin transferase n=1 Tax=Iris pallida TaxID=29817 RepID=A0AAX6FXV3_IRIPA|nr:U-box domain-containing protein 4-like [Iris pallida]